MLAHHLASLARSGRVAAFVVAAQLVLVLLAGPSTAASGGGDFPFRFR